MADEYQIRALVFGRVQGVFFRSNTRKIANSLGVKGFVRNLSDGNVEIVAEGKEEKLRDLIDWAKKGPPLAEVNDVEVEWGKAEDLFKDFTIKG